MSRVIRLQKKAFAKKAGIQLSLPKKGTKKNPAPLIKATANIRDRKRVRKRVPTVQPTCVTTSATRRSTGAPDARK